MERTDLQDRPAKRATLVDVDLSQTLRRRHRKNPALRWKALRALGGFLALMVLFTLLSRAADELTIAKATAKEAEKRSIDHKVSAPGRVEENGAKPVSAFPGVRVAGLSVKAGGKVTKDAPLFTLEEEDLKEMLEETREELKKLDLDIRDQQSRESLEESDRTTAIARANQDYADAKKEADKAVAEAQEALDKAQSRLDSYLAAPAPDLDTLRSACDTAAKALEDAKTALSGLEAEIEQKVQEARDASSDGDPDSAEEAVRNQYQPSLDAASGKVTEAEQKKREADDALAAAGNGDNGSQEQGLRDAVDSARQAYDQALTNRESALKSAARAVEDAQKGTPSDSTAEKNTLARQELTDKISELEGLLEDGGVVRSPMDGVVTKLNVEIGAPVPEGTAALLADGSKGATFTAQVPASQEKFIAPGDGMTLKPGGDKKDVTGLTVASVRKNEENPDLLDVTVNLPDGTLEIGETAAMEAVQKSQDYGQCVPLSALHEDNGSYYLLIFRENTGILGTELTAERLTVEVLDKNDTDAALAEGTLAQGQKFLTDSSKPVEAGDRVRLETP